MSPPTTGDGGESLTVHQWLGRLAPEYLRRFGSSMPGRQQELLNTILSCRTPARGGELFACPDGCGFDYRYHSCNDRHCPLCGQTDADHWLQRQQARLLLPVPYFLVTFTVPAELRLFIRAHLQIGLDLLFACSAQALHELAANPRRLGAQLGMLGGLHTWSRTLIFHPHIHYLIPGGGLSPDGRRWIPAAGHFLLHHKALGLRARTLFKQRLIQKHPQLFKLVPPSAWNKPWNLGCQAAGSGQNALRYLSRYVFKTATSNRLLRLLPEGKLQWIYRNSKTRKLTSLPLEPLEFMRRFLQHILPPHFARVRSFGYFHPAAKVRLNRVRALLHQKPFLTPAQKDTWQPPDLEQTPPPPPTPPVTATAAPAPCSPANSAHGAPLCPHCHKPMIRLGPWRTPLDFSRLLCLWRARLRRDAHPP